MKINFCPVNGQFQGVSFVADNVWLVMEFMSGGKHSHCGFRTYASACSTASYNSIKIKVKALGCKRCPRCIGASSEVEREHVVTIKAGSGSTSLSYLSHSIAVFLCCSKGRGGGVGVGLKGEVVL
jgi:hypothetical protein